MRPKFIAYLTLVVAICLLLFWKFRHGGVAPASVAESASANSTPPSNESGPTGAKNEPSPASSAGADKLQQGSAPGVTSSVVSPSVITQMALIQLTNIVREVQRTVNGPIEFYGKVLDENDRPVEGARIEFECVIYPDDYFSTNIVTGISGLFALKDATGSKLTVRVTKPGYNYASETNQINIYTFSQLPAYERTRFRPDSNNPVVFRLQKAPAGGR